MSTRIRVRNYYTDRRNSTVETVPTPDRPDNLEDWWEDVVFPLTGDGKGSSQYGIYTATVIASDRLELIGLKHEWDG